MPKNHLKSIVNESLENMKALEIESLDIHTSSLADDMIIVTATSSRHAQSIADDLIQSAKKYDFLVHGIEGQKSAEWILVDLGDIIIHIMLPRTRAFYNLERLWRVPNQPEVSAWA